jgi:hypothetical protein
MKWLSNYRKHRAETRAQDDEQVILWRQTSQSLARSIHHLCGLCDDLLDVINHTDAADIERSLVETIPARVDSVRHFAHCIAAEASLPGSAAQVDLDPYSLAQLRRTMDNTTPSS